MQDPEISEKSMTNCYKSKEYTFPSENNIYKGTTWPLMNC